MLRLTLTFARGLSHIALGLALVAFVFPFVALPRTASIIRWWSARLLAICRVRVVVSNVAPPATAAVVDAALAPGGTGAMLVLNHVSWLDIFIVHALRPAHFIAKAEIAAWPLLGFLVDRTGAVFIERGRRHAVREANHRIRTLLGDGELVGMFPEGTTSDGDRLLPFHGNLIQPAIDAKVPIVVAGVRYRDAGGGPTTATLYTGDIGLVDSFVRIVRGGPLTAHLQLIDALDATASTRHQAANAARERIAGALDFRDDADDDLSTVIVVADDARAAATVSPALATAGTGPGTAPDPRDELL